MGSIFFDDKPTLGSFLGALLILAGVLLVTLRMAGVKRSDAAAPTMHASEARKALAQLCNEEADMDTQALLPVTEKHSDSQLTAAEICQPCHDKGQTAAVALIPPQVCGQLPSVHTPSDGGLVSSLATTGMHETPVEADESSGASVLAQIAASAAAALGGELCPAGSTAVGLQLSRQVSRQLCSSRTVSQMSQQVSQWVSSTPSAFLTAPGLPQEWHRPPRLPSQDVQQLGIDFSSIPGTRHQAADQPLQQPQGLTQALLPSSSATGSPISTEPEQQQQQQHL